MTITEARELLARIETEVGRVIVGQRPIVQDVLISLVAGGHVLLEGVPGLGKTLLVRTLADALELTFARIQFTPDLMPADITGTTVLVPSDDGGRVFTFQPGPVFAHLVLADEINRGSPKTQAALLEAMAEGTCSVGGTIHRLRSPFLVLATQNPLEMEGTYPLPEAQLDRFFMKLLLPVPDEGDLMTIVERTTVAHEPRAGRVATGDQLLALGELARSVSLARPVLAAAVGLVARSHPDHPQAPPLVREHVRWGASPRGAQALVLASKVRALASGRLNVSLSDLAAMAAPTLRHRIGLTFPAEVAGVTADAIVDSLVSTLPDAI